MSVTLSISRHEEYRSGEKGITLTEKGIAGAWLGAEIFQQQIGKPDVILTAPTQDAVGTALIMQSVLGTELILTSEKLLENTYPADFFEFRRKLFKKAEETNAQHVHLVTHSPIADMFNRFQISGMNYGSVMIMQAENWKAMANGDFSSRILSIRTILDPKEMQNLISTLQDKNFKNINETITFLRRTPEEKALTKVNKTAQPKPMLPLLNKISRKR